MHVQDIVYEDFVNYKKPSMFIGAAHCSGKCGEACQNKALWGKKPIKMENWKIIENYLRNPITKAVVFGGLEPLDQYEELIDFLIDFRNIYVCMDDVVIYTGYTEEERKADLERIGKMFDNVIVKVGRYIPNRPSKYDETLGVTLASDNQYSIILNKNLHYD